jgi:hypothetical protein
MAAAMPASPSRFCADLELVRWYVLGWAHFASLEPIQQIVTTAESTQMRADEFVGGVTICKRGLL